MQVIKFFQWLVQDESLALEELIEEVHAPGDLLHGVLVDVGVLIQFSEVLYDPESLALFLWNAEKQG